jgi:hypothetical protein
MDHQALSDAQIKTLAMNLLYADSEDDVIAILNKAGYWDDPTAWRLYGDRDGNFATIGNQQARPEAALVEKIVNSVDARLLSECLANGIDPESEQAPSTIRHAISAFIEKRTTETTGGGLIESWSHKQQLDQARRISLAITGNKPRQGMPCITIADQGEGQTATRFPETFLSIDRSNKLRIPFVQGKFNMGGTGALKFCGRHGFQLILSRRNPAILAKWANTKSKWASNDPRAHSWAFTIVRRERPTGATGQVRNSVFRYLAPVKSSGHQSDGEVLSFDSDSLPMLPEENRPYTRESEYGSVVKLYEYDTKGFGSQALMKGGLLSRLEALLPNIALPVRVHECRAYKGDEARSFANSLVGLTVRLNENRADNLETDYPTSSSFVVRNERMTARIYAFKEDKADSYRTNEGILFTINGQTHGHLPKTFFERSRVKMGRLAKSLLVVVDCTELSVGAREDLFMNSRDRLSAGELRKEIEEELESIIREHPGLRELRDRRRNEEIENRLEESKPLEDVLDSILKSSPSLSKLFRFGQRLSRPHRGDSDADIIGGGQGIHVGQGEFKSKPHPTYFRFHRKRDGEKLIRNAEVDRRCRMKFETDAPNDYFERDSMPGHYDIEVLEGPLEGVELSHSCTIHNGIANWSIKLPEDLISAGERVTLQCTVIDDTLIEPFVNVASIELKEHDEHVGIKKGKRASNHSGGDDGDGGTGNEGADGKNRKKGLNESGGLSLPPMIPVKHGDANWHRHGFDENAACKVIEDEDTYTFYVNVDNIFLRTDMKSADGDVALRQTKFLWGNVLVGLALIHDDKQSRENTEEKNDESESRNVFARIEQTTRALSPFLIPMIDYLGALNEEDIGKLAQRGDED